jgi:hypothetical protein
MGDTFDEACLGPSGYTSQRCKDYVGTAITDFVDGQMARKNNSMVNAVYDTNRVFEADMNATYAVIRSQDLLNQKDFIKTYNDNIKNGISHDKDVFHYNNKLETLFFLQLFFIAVLVMAILMYFNRRGVLTTMMTGILTAVLAAIMIIVAISRYFYTSRTRDRRLWNRRYFQSEAEPRPELISVCGPSSSATETTINLNSLFNKSAIDCAVQTNKEYKAWLDAANKEAANQMAGTGTPESIFNMGFSRPDSCKK